MQKSQEITKIIPCSGVSKIIKYLEIREVKDLENENYKTLIKETKYINKWKPNPCSRTKRLKFSQYYLLKRSSRLNTIYIKISKMIFAQIEKPIQNTLERRKILEDSIPGIKTNHKNSIIKTMWT